MAVQTVKPSVETVGGKPVVVTRRTGKADKGVAPVEQAQPARATTTTVVEQFPGEVPPPAVTPGPGEAAPTPRERREAERFMREARRQPKAKIFKPPPGAKLVEKTAQGKPAVYQKGKVRYYAPDSTMYKMGFETSTEYREAQRGKRVEVAPGKVEWQRAAPWVTVMTDAGPAHIKRQQAINLSKLRGKAQFRQLINLGVIPRGSEYIAPTKKGESWSYLTPDSVKAKADIAKWAKETSKIEPFLTAGFEEAARKFDRETLKLPDGAYVRIEDFNDLPDKYKSIAVRQGYGAMTRYHEGILSLMSKYEVPFKEFPRGGAPFAFYEGRIPTSEEYEAMGAYPNYKVAQAIEDKVPAEKLELMFGKDTVLAHKSLQPFKLGVDSDGFAIYDLPSAIKSDVSDWKLKVLFPADVIDAVKEKVEQEEKGATVEVIKQQKNWWYRGKLVSDAERQDIIRKWEKSPTLEHPVDEMTIFQPALVLAADPYWQKLKDLPDDNAAKIAYKERWMEKVLDTASFAALVATPWIPGAIGAIGTRLTIPAASWGARAGVFIPNSVVRLATSLSQLVFTTTPAVHTSARTLVRINEAQMSDKWATLDRLSAAQKKQWAEKAGYKKDWATLDDAEKANVLVHYAKPDEISTAKWSALLHEKSDELIEHAGKGADWVQQRAPTSITAPFVFAGGIGIGVLEGMGYIAQLPLLASQLLDSVPKGRDKEFAAQLATGFAAFFGSIPSIVKSNPALGGGRMTGLFLITPVAMLKFGKALGYDIPSARMKGLRAIALEFSTSRVRALKGVSATDMMKMGEKLVKQLMTKSVDKAVVRVGNFIIKVRGVPYQKVVGDTLFTFTTNWEKFYPAGKPISVGVRRAGMSYLPSHYGSPLAAKRFAVTSASGMAKRNPALVRLHVSPEHSPKIYKLLRTGKVEIEDAIAKAVLDPIGRSSVWTPELGRIPVLDYVIRGEGVNWRGISLKNRTKINALTAKEAGLDMALGWGGRIEQLKRAFKKPERIDKIDKTIKELKAQQPESVGVKGNITRLREPIWHPDGGLERTRVSIVPITADGRIILSRAYASKLKPGTWEITGGGVHITEPGRRGGIGVEKRQPGDLSLNYGRSFESNALQTAKEELGLVGKKSDLTYAGLYKGKLTDYALPGSRVYLMKVGAQVPDLFRFTLGGVSRLPKKGARWRGKLINKPENEAYLTWDGITKIKVPYPVYDVLKGLAAANPHLKINMKNVKPVKTSVWMKARDKGFVSRLAKGKKLDEAAIKNINALEIKRQLQRRRELARGAPPELKDWLFATPDIMEAIRFILGRRKVVEVVRDKKIMPMEAAEILKEASGHISPVAERLLRYRARGNELSADEAKILMGELDVAFRDRAWQLKDAIDKAIDYGYRRDPAGYYGASGYLLNSIGKLVGRARADEIADRRYLPTRLVGRVLKGARTVSDRVTSDRMTSPGYNISLIRIGKERLPGRQYEVSEERVTPYKFDIPIRKIPLIEIPPIRIPPPHKVPSLRVPTPRKPPPRKPPPRKPSPEKPPSYLPVLTRKQSDKRIRASKGAHTWKQGMFWRVTVYPYRAGKDHWLTRGLPLGATDVKKGAGVAYRSIQQIKGVSPKEVSYDMGIQDVFVRRPSRKPGKKGAIKFSRDRKRQTRRTISLKGIRVK